MDRKEAMRGAAAKSPEQWIELWSGWSRGCAEALRAAVSAGAQFEQAIKWGNLLFTHGGPCVLIHVENHRVLLGLFRGKRLTGLAPAIKPSGKFELGNIVFGPESSVDAAAISRLAAAAAALNAELGDPTRRS